MCSYLAKQVFSSKRIQAHDSEMTFANLLWKPRKYFPLNVSQSRKAAYCVTYYWTKIYQGRRIFLRLNFTNTFWLLFGGIVLSFYALELSFNRKSYVLSESSLPLSSLFARAVRRVCIRNGWIVAFSYAGTKDVFGSERRTRVRTPSIWFLAFSSTQDEKRNLASIEGKCRLSGFTFGESVARLVAS